MAFPSVSLPHCCPTYLYRSSIRPSLPYAEEEKRRNSEGKDYIYVHQSSPLANTLYKMYSMPPGSSKVREGAGHGLYLLVSRWRHCAR